MGVKETIAFIGGSNKSCPVLMKKLAQENLRLLFVSNDEKELQELSEKIGLMEGPCEIELLHCAKEGCWEADIIAFTEPGIIEDGLMERIREVATQKIVLCIVTQRDNFPPLQAENLEKWLPHSKVISVFLNSEDMKAEILGNNDEALATVASVLEKPGYKTSVSKNKKH